MIQSVERALHLLTLLAAAREPLGVREVARRSGLTVPTAQNLLKTLAASGFLHFDRRERNYRVGFAALLLADAADPMACIRNFAHPFVERLHQETKTTVALLAVWQGKPMVADWCEPERGLAVRSCGRIVEHPFQLATGRVLLAWHPELVPENDGEMLNTLRRVRAEGCAVTENIGGSGVLAVAAPVFDACGRAPLALGCSAPLFQMDAAARARLRDAVQATAREMGGAMLPAWQAAIQAE
ncbi:MAG: helix-turn-helix domain-containing protein [Lentisphaeria bacterium]|jgi:DNA-binding IclR family transcriptional regulator|nr:helix-turn-helix domain-containing protein [Lentisphaeria bacterium]